MSYKEECLDRVSKTRVMAALRGGFTPERAIAVCEALVEEGFDVLEFTMNSLNPIETMRAVKAHFGDRALVSMGTVLAVDTAHAVLDAGADFVLSPGSQPAVIDAVHERDRLMCAGVATPTECLQAWDHGVRLLKLFPVGSLGVPHFRAIRGPLNHMNFLCDGGMTLENVPKFLSAGAFACGLVEALTGDGSQPVEEISARALALRAAIDAAPMST
ncbi:MAG: bifunctional 4-hydroxy-2-oxoglutarate aldolase/2-dehydro-3-deoxy-phosphogluconate aldolase [Pseudomonadota bacterium]